MPSRFWPMMWINSPPMMLMGLITIFFPPEVKHHFFCLANIEKEEVISNYCSVRKLLHVACFTVVLETCGEQSKQEWRQDCPLWCLSITNHHTSCANWSHSDRTVEVVTPILSSFSLRSGWMVLKMWREKKQIPQTPQFSHNANSTIHTIQVGETCSSM